MAPSTCGGEAKGDSAITTEATRTNRPPRSSVTASLRDFLREFALFAGHRGIATALLVAVGGVLEAFSLVLIIPLISLAMGSDLPSGRIGRAANATLHLFGVETPLGRLALLLGIFGVLIVMRAIVISFRDVAVAFLQIGFVESLRLRIAECLVAAQWDQVVRLRHARIVNLVSGDIQRIGAMTHLFLQFAVSCAMLLAQCILVLLLAPAFAAVALGMLAMGRLCVSANRAPRPCVRRHHDQRKPVVTQFDNAVPRRIEARDEPKSAKAIDRGIPPESLSDLRNKQIDFSRQQSRVRVLLSTVPALTAGLLVLIGFGVFHLAPATLIALVLIITRMIVPVGQIQRGILQLAHALPAYDNAKELERELATIPQTRPRQAAMPPLPDGAIEFCNVSFRHTADHGDGFAHGVRGVSLTLQPGVIVGIAGPSGAGKTTFADLLVGLYPPQQGQSSSPAACWRAPFWRRGESGSVTSHKIHSCFTILFDATSIGPIRSRARTIFGARCRQWTPTA